MKVADYIIHYLADLGIKEVFLVYGSANGDLVDSFTREDKIKYVSVMHEQAGGFMAEAYAKVTGNFGVALATSGPGGMNLVTPIGNCFYDSVPCLFITGQISTKYLRPNKEIRQVGFQESDMVGIMQPITKYSVMVTKPEDIKYELEKALYLMKEGRPGPVHLDLPLDVQKAEIDKEKLIGYKVFKKSVESKDYIEKLFDLYKDIKLAKRPVFLIGGGCKKSQKPLLELGKLLKIPLIPTWNALDIVPNDYEYYGGNVGTYGGKGRNFAIQNCDLLIVLGCRISGRITGGNPSSFARGAKKWVIDVDDGLLQPKNQQLPFDICVKSNVFNWISDFLSVIKGDRVDSVVKNSCGIWWNKVEYWRDKYDPVLPKYYDQKDIVNPYVFARTLSKVCPDNAIIITDCGGNVVVMNQAFETKKGQKFFSNNGNSPMGFSFAAAIGAWFASDKKQPVICVIGDGGMNMNIQELQTIKTYGVNIKVFIMNNYLYGITTAFQKTNFNGRIEACAPGHGYEPPDFLKIAEAYGIETAYSNSNKSIETVIDCILNNDCYKEKAVICNINCRNWDYYSPRIVGWNTPIEDMYPYLPREEFLKNMIIEPFNSYDYKNPKLPDVEINREP